MSQQSFPPPLPHDPPVELLPDLLFVHGSFRMAPGVVINRNMVALRHGGDLTLLDPIRLNPEGEKALRDFGTARHVLRLGSGHGVDDPYTVDRFRARFWCQASSEMHPEPKPDAVLEEEGGLPIPDADLFVFREARYPECAVLWHRHGGVLVTCDAVQHWASTSRCSFLGKVASYATGHVRAANIGPPWRWRNGKQVRRDFERLLELPFDHLIGGHGQPLLGGAREALRASVRRVFG